MNFFLRLFLIGILTYLGSLVFPWWIAAVAGFIGGLSIKGSGINVFISGFLGAGLVWLGMAWSLDAANASTFSNVMKDLLKVGEPMILIAISGAIGGLVAGLGSLTGLFLKKGTPKREKGRLYRS